MRGRVLKNNFSIRINLGTKPIFGHGKAALLEAIKEQGSISAAARKLGMSYRRAWMLTNSMNNNFKRPLIKSKLGGKGGGGAKITLEGKKVIALYRQMEKQAQSSIEKKKQNFIKLISKSPGIIRDDE